MCTLVFGLHVCGPGTVVLATNRDEDPARPSEPPRVLAREPLVAGGRDAIAGGTWLAVRARTGHGEPGVAMLLNRRDPTPGKPGRRSRGLLTLDVASAPDPRERALAEAAIGHYAPCSLVWLSPSESWHLSIRAGQKPALASIPAGWHAITHFELDDAADPRATWALKRLADLRSPSRAEAEKRLAAILSSHGGGSAPAFCLHEGRAPTVSAATLWLAAGEISYRHAQGRPCVTPFEDFTALVG
ncbi:MAG: NRDE family protein [Candidatus Eisenbacteria bacterium]|nr:NRDE family protein [Candidatus Eisenbacteria bacterium]